MSRMLSVAGFKELVAKYGKVAVGVHLTVSAVSVTGCYAAIKNNVDVGAVLQRVGLYSAGMEKEEAEDIQKYEAVALEGKLEGTAGDAHTEDRQSAVHAAVSGGGAGAGVSVQQSAHAHPHSHHSGPHASRGPLVSSTKVVQKPLKLLSPEARDHIHIDFVEYGGFCICGGSWSSSHGRGMPPSLSLSQPSGTRFRNNLALP